MACSNGSNYHSSIWMDGRIDVGAPEINDVDEINPLYAFNIYIVEERINVQYLLPTGQHNE